MILKENLLVLVKKNSLIGIISLKKIKFIADTFFGAVVKTFLNLSKLELLRVLGNISGLTKILKNNKS